MGTQIPPKVSPFYRARSARFHQDCWYVIVQHESAAKKERGNEQKQSKMSFLANRSALRSHNADDCDGSSGRARAKRRWHDRVDTGRTLDAAQVYERGVALEQDPRSRAQLLMTAGQTYASTGQLDRAHRCFERVRALRPEDPEPYSALLTEVFVAQKDAPDAEIVLKEGLDAGVDPVPMFAAFAQVAQASGQPDKARAALVKMVQYAPTYDNLLRLGSFYSGARDYERASQTFRRATEVDPANLRAWVGLAGAEDGAYQYAAADRDYLHARALAPNDIEVRESYAAFQRKLAAGRSDAAQSVAPALGAGSVEKLP